MDSTPLGISFSSFTQEMYIYGSKWIKKMILKNENDEAWKIYLEKKMYREAYEICQKANSEYLDYVTGLYADQLFEQKYYIDASELYSSTTRNFEEICQKYILVKQAIAGQECLFFFKKKIPK